MLEEGEGDWMRIGNVGKGQGAGKCNEAQRGSKRHKSKLDHRWRRGDMGRSGHGGTWEVREGHIEWEEII